MDTWGRECPANDRCHVKELAFLLDPKVEELLQILGVKYLIVPSDPEGEIFVAEYKYNRQQREEVERFLDQIDWLGKIDVANKVAVYKIDGAKDHFYVEGPDEVKPDWRQVNPAEYKVRVQDTPEPFVLVFSEKHDPLWQAKINGQTIDSQEYRGIINSFMIDQKGDLNLMIEFAPQKYVYWGGVVSLIVLAGLISYLIYVLLPRRN